MADGRRKEQWTHTSELLAMLVNVNTDLSKASPVSAAAFNPFIAGKKKKKDAPKMKLTELGGSLMAAFGLKAPEIKAGEPLKQE